MNNSEIVKYLSDNKRYEDLYKLARVTYRFFEPIMSDRMYNEFEQVVKKYKLSNLVNQSYEDDEIPYDLLKEFNLDYLVYSGGGDLNMIDELKNDKTMSIEALTSSQDAWTYFQSVKGERLIFSGKFNGINHRAKYKENKLKISATRARGDNSLPIDTTKEFSKFFPTELTLNKDITILGECIVLEDSLKHLRKKDGGLFTSARMAAISILRTGLTNYNLKNCIKFMVFNADGICDTISGSLEYLKTQGFDIVPYIIIEPNEVPDNFNEFDIWIRGKMQNIRSLCDELDLDTDGMVVDVDRKSYSGSVHGYYSSRNCALKFGPWSFKYYKGVIEDIIIEQQRVNASVKVIIKPTKAEDGSTNKCIVTYNPDYLIKNGYSIGSDIYYERNAGVIAVPIPTSELHKYEDRKCYNL